MVATLASSVTMSLHKEPAAPAPIQIGNAEVSDLITRLVPLVKDQTSEWRGLAITFYGGGVTMRMVTKNNNEYHAKSSTLNGAVQMLTAPSKEIQTALEGWRSQ